MDTIHITKHSEGKRFRVWYAETRFESADNLVEARKIAQRRKGAKELVECWERGKGFERTKRGAWKRVF